MPKMLIDLSTEDVNLLRDLATMHGHKVKPFVEYLVRMQIGAVPPPSVQPVKLQPERSEQIERIPEKVQPVEDTHEEVQPVKVNPLTAARPAEQPHKRTPKPWEPNKNLAAYTEETEAGSGIFTDGKSYAIQTGPIGRQTPHFYQHLWQVEEFIENGEF